MLCESEVVTAIMARGMELELVEHVGCSWRSESRETLAARRNFASSAAWHDAHGDDFTKCDAWLCVCGATDSRGGSWETTDAAGNTVQPNASWGGYQKCTSCGRAYDRDGRALSQDS
jgi:hypothetical protein